ncbi:MAG: PucR family transcriptional regulator [Anaerovoracaceae bacterium]
MYISLSEILKSDVFSKVEILAGKDGLRRKVKRVSVFDCPLRKDILELEIVIEGDFFITCLEQFRYEPEKIQDFITSLIGKKCSGLFIVSEDCLNVMTDQVMEICNDNDFPVVITREEIPYAIIMDAINKYIAIDNLNAINTLKLEKILYGSENNTDKMEVLYSINPNIKQYLRVIYVDGNFNSEISQVELHTLYLNKKNDIFVKGNNNMVFILSDDEVKQLKHHSDATTVGLKDFMTDPILGFSRIYNRKDITKALEEGKRALDTAKTMNIKVQVYSPLSSLQLLVSVKDTQEAHDFYKAYVEAIKKHVSAENLAETLMTLETYVANSGSFSKTAAIMNQHENTIRYRVNKVKSALNLENDNIQFNETIAIAVKLRILIGEKIESNSFD